MNKWGLRGSWGGFYRQLREPREPLDLAFGRASETVCKASEAAEKASEAVEKASDATRRASEAAEKATETAERGRSREKPK